MEFPIKQGKEYVTTRKDIPYQYVTSNNNKD